MQTPKGRKASNQSQLGKCQPIIDKCKAHHSALFLQQEPTVLSEHVSPIFYEYQAQIMELPQRVQNLMTDARIASESFKVL
jgi:hypothetical protein